MTATAHTTPPSRHASAEPKAGDWAHTARAEEQRRRKAKVLARLCYSRGIDARVLEADQVLRRRLARTAEVNPPHEPADGSAGETWHLVVELLHARSEWDTRHDRRPPPPASCLLCASTTPVPPRTSTPCRHLCTVCDSVLHPTLAALGQSTHPTCEPEQKVPARPVGSTPADEAPPDPDQLQLY